MRFFRHMVPFALVCVIGWAVHDAHAGRFLPHGRHLTVQQKVAYFKKSVAHDRQVIRWFLSPHAPRTLQRVTEIGWYLNALAWHRRLLVRYTAKLPLVTILDSCTAAILSREGGMNPHAYNSSSGAYGGPQALPGSKMASAGDDWRDNIWTQIRWMVGYETARYGSPCGALAAWDRQGWY